MRVSGGPLTQGSVHVVRLHRTHGRHGALRTRAERELRAGGQRGTRATRSPAEPPPSAAPTLDPTLTLALPAPGPTGFMIVYMLSPELVESGGETGA